MSMSIDQAFTKMYAGEVHTAYQRQGSKLRNTVRTKQITNANQAQFPKVGTGTATTKARHGLVPVMNVDHTSVTVTLTDYYAGDWVDKLDELKTNIDERQVISNAGAYALGRKTDELIITAILSGSNSTTITMTSAATIRNSFLAAITALRVRDVPDDGNLWGVVSWPMWAALMTVPQFTDADYVGPELPYKIPGQQIRSWLGVNWLPHTGLPVATTTRTGAIYHHDSVGHAIGAEVMVDITWHGDRASHFVNHMMSQGAVLVDANGVQELVIDEATALPTT